MNTVIQLNLRRQIGLNGIEYFLKPDGTQGAIANKFNLVDPQALEDKEYEVTFLLRLILTNGMENLAGCARTTSIEAELRDVHKRLFFPVFAWAGEMRTANVAKIDPVTRQRTQFTFIPSLGNDPSRLTSRAREEAAKEFSAAFSRINRWVNTACSSGIAKTKTEHLAIITKLFKELNDLHPFPEGNGRSTRVFLERQASRHGYLLDFSKVQKDEWVSSSAAACEGRMMPMMQIFGRCSTESPDDIQELRALRLSILEQEKLSNVGGFYVRGKK